MKVLIGTDVLLSYLQRQELEGILLAFEWIERLKAKKFTDLSSIAILTNFVSLDSFDDLSSFEVLEGVRPKARVIENFEQSNIRLNKFDFRPLLAQLNWLFYQDIDFLITENGMSHRIAKQLGVDDKVFTIENFIEKCSFEHQDLDETRGVAIEKVKLGELDYDDRFFNTFKAEYEPYYHVWFKKKKNDDVYVAKDLKGKIRGLLKLKVEESMDDFGNIKPIFAPAKRLKICSFKADFTSQKLGQRFMRVIFDVAIQKSVTEIYVTLFQNSSQRRRLVGMIEQWGFVYYGTKDEKEQVFVRSFRKELSGNPKLSYPYCSPQKGCFLIPINYQYAAQLLPPSNCEGTTEIEPMKQAIKKVLIMSRENKNIKNGAVLLFVENNEQNNMVKLISLGIVENVYRIFHKEVDFINRCRKRSCFSNNILHDFWVSTSEKPIVVDFLYAYHFEKEFTKTDWERMNLKGLCGQNPLMIDEVDVSLLIKNTPYEKIIVAN